MGWRAKKPSVGACSVFTSELSAVKCPWHTRPAQLLGAAGFRAPSDASAAHDPGQEAGGEALKAHRELAVSRDDRLAAATSDRTHDAAGRAVGGHDEPGRRVPARDWLADAPVYALDGFRIA